MPEVFDLSLPPEYSELMRPFDWLSFEWAFELGVPRECVGDFGQRLLLKGLGPLALLALLGGGGALVGVVGGVGGGGRKAAAGAGALGTALPAALATLFALVPSVSARIFSTFSCEEVRRRPEDGLGMRLIASDCV